MSGSGSSSSAFGAAGPALGYLAQVDYALLASLERMDDEDDFAVSIETLDDIVFHDADSGDATEKWQSKHTIGQTRSLSDASTDLWKTLANWIAEPGATDTRLVLLAVAVAGPTAALLRAGPERNVALAQERLERTAHTSSSESNTAYYGSFLELTAEQRRGLLDRVEVFDGTLPVAEVQPLLERAVRKSVKPQRRGALVDRLQGWWHKRAIAHLDAVARGEPDRIGAGELEAELLEIADGLRDENLPIDVLDMAEPTEQEVSESDRIFVAQLRLVALSSERLRKCIYDHNRAFAQRSRWQRDRLLEVGELGRYDRELKEAWERFFIPVGDDDAQDTDEDFVRRQARERFAELDRSNLAPIRRDVREGWVARGSLHVIADRLEIGWHPLWLAHLRDRLDEVRDDSSAGAAA
ncbi:MAG: ABC-three component system protein [Solirubrobacteraceae bacterium]